MVTPCPRHWRTWSVAGCNAASDKDWSGRGPTHALTSVMVAYLPRLPAPDLIVPQDFILRQPQEARTASCNNIFSTPETSHNVCRTRRSLEGDIFGTSVGTFLAVLSAHMLVRQLPCSLFVNLFCQSLATSLTVRRSHSILSWAFLLCST